MVGGERVRDENLIQLGGGEEFGEWGERGEGLGAILGEWTIWHCSFLCYIIAIPFPLAW